MGFVNIAILGSTGSIGRQALDVVRRFPERFKVVALAAGRNWPLLLEQIKEFHPRLAALAGKSEARELRENIPGGLKVELIYGDEGLQAAATFPDADVVLTAVTGTVGLPPTVAALKAGKDIALANKETLVAAGPLIMDLAKGLKRRILPVDSEHSAVWQCLNGERPGEVAKIILTASGGPFRREPAHLSEVTVEMALAHPNWNMGRKITIDSATLMNKGLEVIEARWLFDVDYHNIQVVIHPQSIIHSMVEYRDGSVMAQLGPPDMRIPIQYALAYPQRLANPLPRLDWHSMRDLTFEEPDLTRFPSLRLAYEAGRAGGTLPAVLNAANEVAVEAFLNERIKFTGISEIVTRVIERHTSIAAPELEEILAADQWARECARAEIKNRG